jgi:hypothetical protein
LAVAFISEISRSHSWGASLSGSRMDGELGTVSSGFRAQEDSGNIGRMRSGLDGEF